MGGNDRQVGGVDAAERVIDGFFSASDDSPAHELKRRSDKANRLRIDVDPT